MGKTAVHFGAGNIGRGFVAEYLSLAGYEIVFADVVADLVNKLNAQSTYEVYELGTGSTANKPKVVKNYTAINSSTDEAKVIDAIAEAEIVTCSVGPNILRFIAPVIAKGIAKRSSDAAPLAVIACENMVGNTDKLAEHVKDGKNTPSKNLSALEKKAIFANCAVDRIVADQKVEAPNVEVEQYSEWVVESKPFTQAGVTKPEIKGVKWAEDLAPYIERKLFTVNTSHATAAFFGYNRNKPTIHEAMADPTIKAAVSAAITETAALIVKKHGLPQTEQDEYKNKIIDRISNPNLNDAVTRVGRQPLRKLGRGERFIGAAAALAEMGLETKALLEAIEMAFRFQNVEGDKESEELAQIMDSKSADEVVSEVCGLASDHPLYAKVKAVVDKVQADARD